MTQKSDYKIYIYIYLNVEKKEITDSRMKQRSRSSANGLRRECCEGERSPGMRTVAGSKECEGSLGSRMVAGSKECEGSRLSLIGDGWLLTELHRRRFELHRRRLSLIATVGVQRRRWELNRDGAVELNSRRFDSLFFFFFFFFFFFKVMLCDLVILFV